MSVRYLWQPWFETPDYELAAPGERLSRANTTPVSAPDTAFEFIETL